MDGGMDRGMECRKDRWMMDGWMHGRRKDAWMDGRKKDRWLVEGWIDGWIDG